GGDCRACPCRHADHCKLQRLQLHVAPRIKVKAPTLLLAAIVLRLQQLPGRYADDPAIALRTAFDAGQRTRRGAQFNPWICARLSSSALAATMSELPDMASAAISGLIVIG